MANSLKLELVTPERRILSEMAGGVQLPGREGYLGILPGHAPLLTELGTGELTYQRDGDVYTATVIGGFAEVLADRVIVLAEAAERAEEINLERARAALERARKRLEKPSPDVDGDRARRALERAQLRLRVAQKAGSSNERREPSSLPA